MICAMVSWIEAAKPLCEWEPHSRAAPFAESRATEAMPAEAPAPTLVKEHMPDEPDRDRLGDGHVARAPGNPKPRHQQKYLDGDGRSGIALLTEAVRLMRGAGKLSAPEYLYYRLWERSLSLEDKRAFVDKKAQHLMHLSCNDRHWYQTAADKILFQTIMTGAGLPVPETLAVTQPMRWLPNALALSGAEELAGWLRNPAICPLFAKPAAGKYSLDVPSIDRFDPDSGQLALLGGETISLVQAAEQMRSRNGYILQQRMSPHPRLAETFGPRLWSVRVLVLVRPDRPVIHRALAKIATGSNPADNYWRPGNMIAALDTVTGQIKRVVRGVGADLTVCTTHPDTGACLSEPRSPIGSSCGTW